MTTFTAATWIDHPSEPHTGVIAAHFQFSGGDELIGIDDDVILLCRLPSRALVLDVQARVNVRCDQGELRLFITRDGASSTATLASVGSLSVSVLGSPLRFASSNGFAPFRLSFTQSSGLGQFAGLKAKLLNSSATASFSIDGYVLYQRGGKVS